MLKITGGQKISGEVTISGSKNASLPVIAAGLLLDKVTLHNVPRIGDVITFLDIIKSLGVKVEFEGNTVKMDSTGMNLNDFKRELINKIRVGIFLLPPILERFGEIEIPYPGGCNIGKRPIDEHIKGLIALGYENLNGDDKVHIAGKIASGDKELTIDWFSVTATETILIAAAKRPGKTTINLGAIEPHVMNLIGFLNKAGAKITLEYDHTIIIEGSTKLEKEIEFEIISDYIESGTFAILGSLASDNHIDIKNACLRDLKSFLNKMKEAGVKFEEMGNDTLRVYNSIDSLKAVRFQTNIFPGFPTDLQSPFCILLTQADGVSKVEEILYEGRLNFMVEIEKMKGHPAILNPHEALIFGKTKLRGATVSSWDLRAGAAMMIAGMIASGDTYITNVEYIERGYEDIIGKIKKLGAKIEKVTSE